MRSLVVGEWEDGAIADATLRVIRAASERGVPVDVLTFSSAMAKAAACINVVGRVLLASDDVPNPETLAALLQHIASDYSMISSSHRSAGRAALPRRSVDRQRVSRGHHARCDGTAFRARPLRRQRGRDN